MTGEDLAPLVYSEDGTPLRVRMVGGDCMGDVSGEGHYGYDLDENEEPTVYFEKDDA